MDAHKRAAFTAWLASEDIDPQPIIALPGRRIVLDLGAGSLALGAPLEGIDVERFSALIDARMQQAAAALAYGRWGERRTLYDNDNFGSGSDERRIIHMGIDVFCRAGTPVCAPLAGVVDIVADNAQELDYGPLLVVRHPFPAGEFYTLYGHLGPECLSKLQQGDAVAAGQPIATVGSPPGNGNWPPHLHFQLILDLLHLGKDFPGVARASEQEYWLELSPNPARFFPDVPAVELDGRG